MKLYYSKQKQRYEVSEWTPQGRQLIDHDKDLWELGLRQGFFSKDELDQFLNSQCSTTNNN
jgi:hypothetical protein